MINNRQKPLLRYSIIGILVVILVGFGGFYFWATNTYEIEGQAKIAKNQADYSRIDQATGVTFTPKSDQYELGFIIYPGARVSPEAYAPLAKSLADSGYLVSISRLNLNFAFFESKAADQIIAAYPEISTWVIGGHSLGGVVAASYAANNPQLIDGLVLLASYPAGSNDLSETSVEVLSIYGNKDGLSTIEEVRSAAEILPEQTRWVKIEGGNHSGFGYYGDQKGDLPATITKEAQQKIILESIVTFFQGLLE
jgi:hypothetical protein